jgi:cysteine desulfurase family protein (TIGR01976 family)
MQIDWLREQFAGLHGEWALMDNAGGSQILRSVMRRIEDYLETCNVQHGASYGPSREAVDRLAESRAAMATWTGAADPDEIVFGPTTSQLLRTLGQSIGRGLGPGDEVVVTTCDHEANIAPWVELADRGVELRYWKVDPETLTLRLEDLDALMTARTRLVAWTHVSNVLGRIHPVRELASFVRERGALSCVDGVACAPHRAIDVQDLGVDFYAVSLYKVFGPHLAMLYARREVFAALPPVNHFFISRDDLPYKFQPGGPNYELGCSLMGLWDYIEEVGARIGSGGDRRTVLERVFDAFADREAMLAERLLGFLRDKEGVRIIGPEGSDAEERVCTISFVVDGRRSDEIVRAADEAKLGIRYGDFYAHRLIDELGLREQGGVVRVSLLHYNTVDEVDRLVAVLDRAI